MSGERNYSVIDDSLLTVRRCDQTNRKLSLPELIAGIIHGRISELSCVQPHQWQAVHCFLVQLAVITVYRTGLELTADAEGWKNALLALTANDSNPWHLVVEDLSAPAFFQTPIPEGSLSAAGYKPSIYTPDDIDMLVTSKNHDIKQHRIRRPSAEHWIYALITLQTLEGVQGRGNYGIARMNSGYGSRVFAEFAPGLDLKSRFLHDVKALLDARTDLVNDHGYDESGHALLWVLPWGGEKNESLPLSSLDPFFIEVCRRLRFLGNGEFQRYAANTQGERVQRNKDLKGVLGDPWAPVDVAEAKVMSVSQSGFPYDMIRELLLGARYKQPVAMRFKPSGTDGGYLVASGLARGKGQTGGFHQRILYIPSGIRRLLSSPKEKEALANRSKTWVDLAGSVSKNILQPTLRALFSAGRNQRQYIHFEKINPWIKQYTATVDDVFFLKLWDLAQQSDAEARPQWQETLFRIARETFEAAIKSVPLSTIDKYRAISKAESVFYGRAARELSERTSLEKTEKENLP
jgi:CRISPR system Cascade subunit CasA